MGYLSVNKELEQCLLLKVPSKFQEGYQEKLKRIKDAERWQVISEMRSVIVFEQLGMFVNGIDVPTAKKKNVDFIAQCGSDIIYVEVKGRRPEKYEKAKQGGILVTDEMFMERVLRKSKPKFLEDSYTILVLADENTVKPSLFDQLMPYFDEVPPQLLSSYKQVGALMVLGGMYYETLFQFKIWYNEDAKKELTGEMRSMFNGGAVNAEE